MPKDSVSLVCMPWHTLGSPSIQLGTLQALLARSDVPCRSHSFFLEFMRFVTEREPRNSREAVDLGLDDYAAIASEWMNVGAGEWIFALPAIRARTRDRDERFLALCRRQGMSKTLAREIARVRERVPEFLELCADEVLAGEPAVVGFTAVYSQTIPSAALAHVLKRRDPSLAIVFGGASCEGPMGPAILRAFGDVDVVLRGEAELAFPELVASLIRGSPPPRRAGLCFRARDTREVVEIPADEVPRVAMDDVPVPIYDEYFERLASSGLASSVMPQIPFETARGCWWGMKSHCTFCGLNGLTMAFRSKSPDRVVEEVASLARRHGVLDFMCTDNILDMRYFASVLPALAQRGGDLSVFCETKANLTEAQVKGLEAAGVRAIQPGIESLSTPVLALMKKGVTAFQNVRLLKWCARHGVRVVWNLLYGFPGEAPEEYARMAELVPSLVHLEPPTLSALMVYRFSPYHARPAEHGLRVGEPLPYYGLLYDVGADVLRDLAQVFEFEHADGRDPEAYVGPLRERVEQWNRERERNAGALTYRRGPGFLAIVDTRTTGGGAARYTLGEAEARAYLACESGATLPGIARDLATGSGAGLSDARLASLLRDFVDARLVYEERGRYLSLALPNVR